MMLNLSKIVWKNAAMFFNCTKSKLNVRLVYPCKYHLHGYLEIRNNADIQSKLLNMVFSAQTLVSTEQWLETKKNNREVYFASIELDESEKWVFSGYVQLTVDNNEVYIGLVVLPSMQKKGIARSAILLVENFCREMNYDFLIAQVHEDNSSSRALFSGTGFMVREKESNKLIYCKRLKSERMHGEI